MGRLDGKTVWPAAADDGSNEHSGDERTEAVTASDSSVSVDDNLDGEVDERLLLPAVAIPPVAADSSNVVRRRSGTTDSNSGSRRKRSARPRTKPDDGGRYLLSSLSSSTRKIRAPSLPSLCTEDFPPNDALVGDLNVNRVAEYVLMQLNRVAEAVKGMCDSLESMKEGCHPFIFYHRVRPFLSAWKQVGRCKLFPIHNPCTRILHFRREFFTEESAKSV